jgi:hypothetical protein
MAGAIGLVIALAVGLPSLLSVPKPAEPAGSRVYDPASSTGAPARPAPSEDAPAPADNQTVLQTNITSGAVTLVVNNQAVARPEAGRAYDLTPFVHPGRNVIILRWSAPTQADFRVAHAAIAGDFRDAGQAYLTLSSTRSPGQQALTFYL